MNLFRLLKSIYRSVPPSLQDTVKSCYFAAQDMRHERALGAGLFESVSGNKSIAITLAAKKIAQDNATRHGASLKYPAELVIVNYIGQLGCGGAEKQLFYLAERLTGLGSKITTLTSSPLSGPAAHYKPALEKLGVECRMPRPVLAKELSSIADDWVMLVPPYLSKYVYALALELARIKPDVLHCWLDDANVIGALAGLMTGVPRIVMSAHSLNPSHFPHIRAPWHKPWYSTLLQSGRVTFTNNSRCGAEDYAQWLEIDADRITVIHNGMDFTALNDVDDNKSARFRESINAKAGEPLIGGVFRMSPEKRPFDFLNAVKKARELVPVARAVVSGTGPLAVDFSKAIVSQGLHDVVMYLGWHDDVYSLMKACDAVLVASEMEGIPTVILESQYMGTPVVATSVGGIPEVIENGVTGILAPVGDSNAMGEALAKILKDPGLKRRLGQEGAKSAAKFSIEKMTETVLRIYNGEG
ncbi:MAG: glycosyltransferase family 4 protein [Nitrospinae bacterium]|nr:glycosyltransferase family 4 protein [Nitrospinota bacterium]